jgi:hypothetical protein
MTLPQSAVIATYGVVDVTCRHIPVQGRSVPVYDARCRTCAWTCIGWLDMERLKPIAAAHPIAHEVAA